MVEGRLIMHSMIQTYFLHQLLHTQPNVKIVYLSMEYTHKDFDKLFNLPEDKDVVEQPAI